MATIPEALALALQHHQAGRLPQAEEIYRQVLSVEPHHVDALHLLGVLAHQSGRHEVAIEYIQTAIAINGGEWAFHYHLAEAFHDQGNLEEAATCCRQSLGLNPHVADVHNKLGDIFCDQGKHSQAADCYLRALELRPDRAEDHNNLGVFFQEHGKIEEAVACYRRALELQPQFAAAHNNLGVALQKQAKLDEAVVSYRRALQLQPHYAAAHFNLGNALREQKHWADAEDCYRRVLRLEPDHDQAHINLGIILGELGKLDESAACYRQAMRLNPKDAAAHNNLGLILRMQGNLQEAAVSSRRALELCPTLAEANTNLGDIFLRQGNPDQAIVCFRQSLNDQPNFEAHLGLGNAYKDQGKLEEAIASYFRAIQLKPDFHGVYSNLLLTLLYSHGKSPADLAAAHAEFNQRFGILCAPRYTSYPNDRSPDRRLRIGYLSPDFRGHVVGRNAWPVFQNHDRELFEIFAYAHLWREDEYTERFQALSHGWRNVVGLTDEALAQQVRDDRIDILIDLALHTAGNRLLAVARKPAPVQVTFVGYPGTTGLSAIDYRLTDPYLDPPGLHDEGYGENSFRLPNTFWCYDPPGQESDVNPLPAGERGPMTFGCLNSFYKVNDSVLRLWAQVVRQVEGSRLLILAPKGSARQETTSLLAREGVAPEQVFFHSRQPHRQYLELYHQIDIGLDTFPYNGHTTSLDSYWMGVPVVTLVGQTVVGRAGLSQLTNLGLTELIAQTPEEFVSIAVELAKDLPRLSLLRSTLRERMKKSPLMDPVRFTRGIEASYRTMWRRWCGE